jgi:hypothetical protein
MRVSDFIRLVYKYMHQKSGLIDHPIIRPDFWCIYLYTSLIKSLTPIKDHPIIRPDFWCIYLYNQKSGLIIGWSLMGVSDFIRLVYKYLHQKSGLIIGWSLIGVSDFIRLVYKYMHQMLKKTPPILKSHRTKHYS